jgi:hypothetical protein
MAMRKKINRKNKRVAWTKQHVSDLKAHSKKKKRLSLQFQSR